MTSFAGIDYGSKLAGTTVIAFPMDQRLHLFASSPKKDADQFILDWVQKYAPSRIFIDAPLSLPGVYQKMPGYEDFFYREADRETRAMSPMFLGGLTARAMQLTQKLHTMNCTVTEVYPAYLAKMLKLNELKYKKNKAQIPVITQNILDHLPFEGPTSPLSDWHHIDALLAFLSGYRFQQKKHLTFGKKMEGSIIV